MKITVSQLRRIIREEVIRLTGKEKVISAGEFNAAAKKVDVDYVATGDVTVVPGDGGNTLLVGGEQITGIKPGQIHPDDVKYILRALDPHSRGPKQYGSPGMGGG